MLQLFGLLISLIVFVLCVKFLSRSLSYPYWFASYLSNRSQKVTVDGVLSDRFGIDFGVPQGSCLGPLLFVIYSSKLFNIVSRHLTNVHVYADDTQLYLAFKPGNYANETSAVSSIQTCIRDLQNWMLMDKLKLNPEKTKFLILGTRPQLEKVITLHLLLVNLEYVLQQK